MPTMLDRTKALLARTDAPLREIAQGAGVGLEWLKKFVGGHIDSPGVTRVQALHDYLLTTQRPGEEKSDRARRPL